MAQVTVTFTFVPSPDELKYAAYVDSTPLNIVNGQASIVLPQGEEHIVYWWMWGNAGDSLAITGNNGSSDVLTVKASTIPTNTTKAAGYKRFTP